MRSSRGLELFQTTEAGRRDGTRSATKQEKLRRQVTEGEPDCTGGGRESEKGWDGFKTRLKEIRSLPHTQ